MYEDLFLSLFVALLAIEEAPLPLGLRRFLLACLFRGWALAVGLHLFSLLSYPHKESIQNQPRLKRYGDYNCCVLTLIFALRAHTYLYSHTLKMVKFFPPGLCGR